MPVSYSLMPVSVVWIPSSTTRRPSTAVGPIESTSTCWIVSTNTPGRTRTRPTDKIRSSLGSS